MPLALDPFEQITNVHWGGECSFAVVGYDGNFTVPPFGSPVYFGVGAYSDDGRSWTTFKVFDNGATAAIFHMSDPFKVVVGGNSNEESGGIASSTALLKTVAGTGPTDSGGHSPGRNVANFGSIGYGQTSAMIYAVENSGTEAATQTLHRYYENGLPVDDLVPMSSEDVLWAGSHYPEIAASRVTDCSTTGAPSGMKVKDEAGKECTLTIEDNELHLEIAGTENEDTDITPSDAEVVASAAAGLNARGELIVIAVGYKEPEDDEVSGGAAAWWSVKGTGWTEIAGIWSDEPLLQAAQMATAVTI